MADRQPPADLELRPYRDADEPAVLELLTTAFGTGPTTSAEFLRWKHQRNPFGPSLMLVAEADGGVVAFRAYMPWRLRAGGQVIDARQGVDFVTHPKYRRMGIALQARRHGHGLLRERCDLIFGRPNQAAQRMARKGGSSMAGGFPVSFRVRRPIALTSGRRSGRDVDDPLEAGPPVEGEPAAAALADDELAALLEGATTPDPRFGTLRDVQYLRWRYGSVPGFDYRAIRARKAGRLSGLAIFRGHRTARPWKTSLVELISAPDDRQVARRLVRQVGSASGADYLACHFPAGSAAARAARRSGFVRSQHRVSLVTDPFRGDLRPDPVDVRNWTMSLGDLELL